MIGKLKDLTINRDGSQNITLTVQADFREEYDELSEGDVKVEIKKYNPARSLDASAKAWVIIDQIAAKTGIKKHEVYRNAIRDIGGVSDTVCVKNEAVPRLCSGWSDNGIGWQYETFPSKIPGCTNVTLYYGSSVYDRKQMSLFLDSLVQDAEALGIPTISPEEQERLLIQWGKKIEKKQGKENEAEHLTA